jgi:YhcH/YjgK/YiaL family protein
MIFGDLAWRTNYAPLFSQSPWREAWEFITALPEDPELGITELQGERLYVNVHTYATKPVEACNFETHRHTVDLQVVLRGGEYIDWMPRECLQPAGEWDAEKDFQFYQPPQVTPSTRVHLTAGRYVVFYPNDGHRPQMQDGRHDSLVKAVAKIHTSLLT